MHYRILLIVAAAALLAACSKSGEAPKIEPLAVTTESPRSEGTLALRNYVGTVEPQSTTLVSFTGSGTLKRILVKEGAHVSRGQLIAELDDTQARNMLAAAKAQMDQASDAQARMQQLHDAGSLPDIKWVEVQSQVQQAQSQLAMAQKQLADCRIVAPVSGVVGSRMVEPGMTVLPAQPLCNILDISSVKVRVSIPEREVASIKPSTPTTIEIAAIGRSLHGGRIEKGVEADAATHTYDVLINIANQGGAILPGMVANVSIDGVKTASEASTTTAELRTVPIKAVQQNSRGEQFVWVVTDSTAHRQPVTVGEVSGNRIAITEGLAADSRVIVEGYQKVGEGTRVIAQ